MTHHEGGQTGTGNAPGGDEPRVIDDATVAPTATVAGGVFLSRSAAVGDEARVVGAVEITDHGQVNGNAVVEGSVRIDGHAQVSGDARVTGQDIHIGDQAVVAGNAVVTGNGIVIKDRARVGDDHRVGSGAQLLHADHVYSWDGGHDGRWTVFRTANGHSAGIREGSDETVADLEHSDKAPHALKTYVKAHTWG